MTESGSVGRGAYLRSMVLFGAVVGALAAVGFQFVYVPLTTDIRLTVAFIWGIFFLLFEVPAGVIVGAIIALIVAGVNAVLPPPTSARYRTLLAGSAAAVTFAAIVFAAELLVPGESGFTLVFYASVTIGLGLAFGICAWLHFRRDG